MNGFRSAITGFLQKPGKHPLQDLLVRIHADFPEFPLQAALFVAIRFSFLANGKTPEPGELFLLRGFLSALLPESDDTLDEALKSANSSAVAMSHAETLAAAPLTARIEFFSSLFSFFNFSAPLPTEAEGELSKAAEILKIPHQTATDLRRADEKIRADRTKILNSGTGLAAALGILLIVVLAATYLKVVFFGFLLAYLFLPLEQFYERRICASRICGLLGKGMDAFLYPVRALRNAIMRTTGLGGRVRTPDEREKARLEQRASKAAVLTILSVLAAFLGLVSLAVTLLLPVALNAGDSLSNWAKTNPFFKDAEQHVSRMLATSESLTPVVTPPEPPKADASASVHEDSELHASLRSEDSPSDHAQTIPPATGHDISIKEWLQHRFSEFVKQNAQDLAAIAFNSGSGVVQWLFSIAGMIGSFAVDLLLTLFFMFFFLLKMAIFLQSESAARSVGASDNIGSWTVQSLANSAWFPQMKGATKEAASLILSRIYLMFNAWVRGYFTIMAIEFVLYLILFTLFSVPYAPILAGISCMTVLLPFLGILICVCLNIAVTVAFLDAHLAFTLIGVIVTYLLVNGILEQLILYPSLVGEAIGLRTIETIIVVLLGAALAGITGMILAVPTAALLKFLIPKIYQSMRQNPKFLDDGVVAEEGAEGVPAEPGTFPNPTTDASANG